MKIIHAVDRDQSLTYIEPRSLSYPGATPTGLQASFSKLLSSLRPFPVDVPRCEGPTQWHHRTDPGLGCSCTVPLGAPFNSRAGDK